MLDVADAASAGDVVMILLPDEKQAEVWESEIRDGIAPGNLLLFAHGFTIHFDQIDPPPEVDVGDGRAQGPGPPRAAPVRRGPRRAGPDRDPPGRDAATRKDLTSPTRRASAACAPA